MSFQAGNAYITVTPSLRGFQKAIRRGVENSEIGKSANRKGEQIGAGVGAGMAKSIQAGSGRVSQAVGKVFSAARGAVSRAGTFIGQTFMQYVGRPIADRARAIGQAISSAFSSAARWVGNAASTVGRAFMNALPASLSRGLSRLGRTIGDAFSAAGRWVANAASTVGGVFTNTLIPAVSDAASRVASTVSGLFNGAKDSVSNVGRQVADTFSWSANRGINGANFSQAFHNAFNKSRAVAAGEGGIAGSAWTERTASSIARNAAGVSNEITRPFTGVMSNIVSAGNATGLNFANAQSSTIAGKSNGIRYEITRPFTGVMSDVVSAGNATGLRFNNASARSLGATSSSVSSGVMKPFTGVMSDVASAGNATGLSFTGGAVSSLARSTNGIKAEAERPFTGVMSSVAGVGNITGLRFSGAAASSMSTGGARAGDSFTSRLGESLGRGLGNATAAVGSWASSIGGTLSSLGPQIANIGTQFSKVGAQISGVGSTMTKAITLPIAGATAAAGGLVASLGFGRLVGLDTAKAQLRGLGYEASDVDRITGQLVDDLEGGMMTMADATSAAAGAMAAGVEEGAELTKYIQMLDAAVVGGNGTFYEMNNIFSRTADLGYLNANNFDMMAQRMPGFSSAMQEHTGKSGDAFREMLNDGEISLAEFLDVMDDFGGGMAKEYARSWAGMWQNTKNYIGIIGESILTGVFQRSKEELGDFINALSSKKMAAWANEFGTRVNEVFGRVVDVVKNAINWWRDLDGSQQRLILTFGALAAAAGPAFLIIGKFASALGSIMKVAKPVMGWLGSMASTMGAAITNAGGLGTVLRGVLGRALGVLTGPIGWIVTGLALLWANSEDFRNSVINLGKVIWGSLVSAFQTLWPHLQELGGALGNLFSTIFSGGGKSSGVMDTLGKMVAVVIDAFSWLLPILVNVSAQLLSGLVVAITWVVNALSSVVQVIFNVLGVALSWLADVAFPAVGTAAIWLWQNALLPAWNGIKWAIQGVVSWFQSTGWPILQTIFSALGTAMRWLWVNVAQPAFTGIRIAFSAVATAISWAWSNILQPTFQFLGAAIRWVWNNVARPIFGFLRSAWNGMATAFMWVWSSILQPVFSAVGAIVRWLWNNVAKPYFNFVKAAWRALATAFMWIWNNVLKQVFILVIDIIKFLWNTVARPLFSAIRSSWNRMATAMRWVWANILKPTWDRVAAVARWLWNNVAKPVFGFIKSAWDAMVRAMRWAWANILKPTWDRLVAVIRWVWNNVAKPVFGYIKDRWDWMTKAIRHIWTTYLRPMFQAVGDFIKNTYRNHIKPAFGWIRDRWNWLKDKLSAIWENGIKPVFKKTYEFVENEVVDRIAKGVDAIKLAWRKLKQWFASPIIWVIDTVWNNGIRKAFNTVADKINSDAKISKISTKKLEAFRTGGAVSGPGTGTSDDIVARLSNGEHVLTAKEVRLLGGQDAVYDLRNRINSGQPLTGDQKSRVASANGRDFTASEQDRLISGNNSILPVGNPAAGQTLKGSAKKKKSNWDKVKEGFSNTKDWVLGGLASMVGKIFDPLKKMAENKMGKYKSIGTLGLDLVKWGIDNVLGFTKDKDDEHNASMEGGGAGGQGLKGMDAFLWALRQVESTQDYRATNPYSDASGAYQFVTSTWGGYGGFRRAADAPKDVQDAKARKNASEYYNRYGNWRQTAAAWLYPAMAGNPGGWGMSPGVGNPSINSYVNKVMAAMKTAQAPKDSGGGSFTGNPGGWNRPSSGPVTSWYGHRNFRGYYGNMHYGIDLAAGHGAPVRAAWSGTVAKASRGPGTQGNVVDLNHGGQWTRYFHLAGFNVRPGQKVKGGQQIAREGGTGGVAPHLHFERHKSRPGNHPSSTAMNVNGLFRDKGGLLPQGISTVLNKTGGAEYISNQRQFDNLTAMAEKLSGSGGTGAGMTVNQYGMDYRDAPGVANELGRATRRASRNGRYPMGVGR